LLYHGFGIQGPYHHVSTKYENGSIILNIAHNTPMKCPMCRFRSVTKKGIKPRRFHGEPIGTKPTTFVSIAKESNAVIGWTFGLKSNLLE
ncbi:transposase family protein, partial [Shewanella sp. 202IG2-18]|uniref:transposase family protein n=1 Tax=Parashewanella hymeniacidonis TaxID=2807618 RepID=UPI00195F5109